MEAVGKAPLIEFELLTSERTQDWHPQISHKKNNIQIRDKFSLSSTVSFQFVYGDLSLSLFLFFCPFLTLSSVYILNST